MTDIKCITMTPEVIGTTLRGEKSYAFMGFFERLLRTLSLGLYRSHSDADQQKMVFHALQQASVDKIEGNTLRLRVPTGQNMPDLLVSLAPKGVGFMIRARQGNDRTTFPIDMATANILVSLAYTRIDNCERIKEYARNENLIIAPRVTSYGIPVHTCQVMDPDKLLCKCGSAEAYHISDLPLIQTPVWEVGKAGVMDIRRGIYDHDPIKINGQSAPEISAAIEHAVKKVEHEFTDNPLLKLKEVYVKAIEYMRERKKELTVSDFIGLFAEMIMNTDQGLYLYQNSGIFINLQAGPVDEGTLYQRDPIAQEKIHGFIMKQMTEDNSVSQTTWQTQQYMTCDASHRADGPGDEYTITQRTTTVARKGVAVSTEYKIKHLPANTDYLHKAPGDVFDELINSVKSSQEENQEKLDLRKIDERAVSETTPWKSIQPERPTMIYEHAVSDWWKSVLNRNIQPKRPTIEVKVIGLVTEEWTGEWLG